MGKISRSEFKNWIDFALQEEVIFHQKDLNKLTSNQIITNMYYEKKHHFIWYETSLNDFENDIREISFLLPTEKGILQLYGNCIKNDYEECKSIFWQIVKSIQVSKELEYNDNLFKKKSTYVVLFLFLSIYFITLMTIKTVKARYLEK